MSGTRSLLSDRLACWLLPDRFCIGSCTKRGRAKRGRTDFSLLIRFDPFFRKFESGIHETPPIRVQPVKIGQGRLRTGNEDMQPKHQPWSLAKFRSLAHAGWSVLFRASVKRGKVPDSRTRSIASICAVNNRVISSVSSIAARSLLRVLAVFGSSICMRTNR